jgi:hypothetical protein
MNKNYLQSQIKSTNTAYVFWFFLGAHYAYLGRWGTQILYWLTLGGLGFWALIDLFSMRSKVEKHNLPLFNQIEKIENAEKESELNRHLAVVSAISGKAQN